MNTTIGWEADIADAPKPKAKRATAKKAKPAKKAGAPNGQSRKRK